AAAAMRRAVDPDRARAGLHAQDAERRLMRAWPSTFRSRLTLRWTVVFGVLLAVANATVYVAVRLYAYADLDAKVRTLAATETVSSTDGPVGLHVHELPVRELGLDNYTQKFVQIFDDQGHLTAAASFPG